VSPPKTVPELIQSAEILRAKGIEPLSVSASGGWTIALMLFDIILPAEAGADFQQAYLAGDRAADSLEIRTALTDLAKLLDYANDDRTGNGWGDSVVRVCRGQSAMVMIPDFAKYEVEGKDPYTSVDCLTPDKIGYVPLEAPNGATFVFDG